jgi:hypothetical protein
MSQKSQERPDQTKADPGGHYRFSFNGVQMDPYRIALVHGVRHPIAFHIMKKILRGTRKGHSEEQLVAELEDCVRRWKEMLVEDQLQIGQPPAAEAALGEDNLKQ